MWLEHFESLACENKQDTSPVDYRTHEREQQLSAWKRNTTTEDPIGSSSTLIEAKRRDLEQVPQNTIRQVRPGIVGHQPRGRHLSNNKKPHMHMWRRPVVYTQHKRPHTAHLDDLE